MVFSLRSNVVSWTSKKQLVVALSSTEVEYMEANAAACQIVWLRKVMKDLCHEEKEATLIYCDNLSTVNLSKNIIFRGRIKHVEIKHYYICELIVKDEVKLVHLNTEDETTDVLTKSLPSGAHDKHRMTLGVRALN